MQSLLIILTAVFLASCATGETTSRSLYSGQWTPVRNIGQGKYLIEGYSTSDAINGGAVHCLKFAKEFVASEITPSTRNERATVTFICK